MEMVSCTIANALLESTQVLRNAGVPEARREAGSLLSHVLSRDRTFLITHAEDLLTPEQLVQFRSFIERRSVGEPLQYITGTQDFFGREFLVTRDVLIPRPETELLVTEGLRLLNSGMGQLVCDVGTGSGCIVISLLCERRSLRGLGLDISAAALEVAKTNAERHHVNDRLSFAVSDCFAAIATDDLQFDLIVSNPPYVALDALDGLQREVRDYEPRLALTPGSDGLSVIRRLLVESQAYLKNEGHLMLEIGFDQGNVVRDLISATRFWRLVDILPDLQGIPRTVVLKKLVS